MKSIGIVWMMILMLGAMLALEVKAGDEVQTSRSAGKLKQDQGTDLGQLLREREPVSRPAPLQSEHYAASEQARILAGIANRPDQVFAIFEADVELLSDLDGDGYHHAINVFFDVDVNLDSATVYAQLYLSRNGGPWSQYYTTDLFVINGNDYADAYEVETELINGYPPGYYDVLVEIYSLNHAYMVASEVLDYNYLGREIPLEDLARDDDYSGHGGSSGASSVGSLLLFLLLIQIVIAARGFPALTPCKKRQ